MCRELRVPSSPLLMPTSPAAPTHAGVGTTHPCRFSVLPARQPCPPLPRASGPVRALPSSRAPPPLPPEMAAVLSLETEPWRLAAFSRPDSLEARRLRCLWCEARPHFVRLLARGEPRAVTAGGRRAELPRGRGVDMISRLSGGCPVDSQLLTHEATVGCSGPPSELTKRWGEGRGRWYQREGSEEAHGLVDDLGDPSPPNLADPHQRGLQAPASQKRCSGGPVPAGGGGELTGARPVPARGGQLEEETLCGGQSPRPQQYVCPQISVSGTWEWDLVQGRALCRRDKGEDLEMRLSWRRPVVLAPTTCPQKRPKERDTDPEEEQCDQELRLRDVATGPGSWEMQVGPFLGASRGSSALLTPGFQTLGSELQEDELLLFGAWFAVQHHSHPRPGGRHVCRAPTTPGGSPFWGQDEPRMQGEGWAWRGGPHRPSSFFCHPASPQLSSRTRRPGWAPLPRVTRIWEDSQVLRQGLPEVPAPPQALGSVPTPPSP